MKSVFDVSNNQNLLIGYKLGDGSIITEVIDDTAYINNSKPTQIDEEIIQIKNKFNINQFVFNELKICINEEIDFDGIKFKAREIVVYTKGKEINKNYKLQNLLIDCEYLRIGDVDNLQYFKYDFDNVNITCESMYSYIFNLPHFNNCQFNKLSYIKLNYCEGKIVKDLELVLINKLDIIDALNVSTLPPNINIYVVCFRNLHYLGQYNITNEKTSTEYDTTQGVWKIKFHEAQ